VETPRGRYVDRIAIPQTNEIGSAVSVAFPPDTGNTDSTLQHIPISVALVVDASSSITEQLNQIFRDGCQAFLDSLDGVRDQGAILFFTERAVLAQRLTTSVSHLRNAVNGIPHDGATALWDGIHKAMLELDSRGVHERKAVIVITDSDDNSSMTGTPAKIISLGETAGIAVHSIVMGISSHQQMLGSISERTGGRYVPQPSRTNVVNIYRELAHAMKSP
jgi:Mg-chelatase subunit ChlD